MSSPTGGRVGVFSLSTGATDSVTGMVVATPFESVTTTEYAPALSVVASEIVYEELVAPLMALPLKSH